MRAGRSPQEACEDALAMIRRRYAKVNPSFMPREKFVALNARRGRTAARGASGARMCHRMSVRDEAGLEIYDGNGVRRL